MRILKLSAWYGLRIGLGFMGAAVVAVLSHAKDAPFWQAASMAIGVALPTLFAGALADMLQEGLTQNWSPPWEIAASKVTSGAAIVEFAVAALFVTPVALFLLWLGFVLPDRKIIFDTGTLAFMSSWAAWSIGSCVRFRNAVAAISLFP